MDKEFKNQFITSDVVGLAKYRDDLLASVSAITIEKKNAQLYGLQIMIPVYLPVIILKVNCYLQFLFINH